MKKAWRLVALLGIGAVLFSVVAISVLLPEPRSSISASTPGPGLLPCREGPGLAPGELRPICALFDIREPLLPGGAPISLVTAAHIALHPIYVPHDLPPALRDHHPQAWRVDRQVSIRYRAGSESGLVLTFALWPTGVDPVKRYSGMTHSWDAGYTTTIAGHPAWVVPRDEGREHRPFSAVHVTFDRTEVSLLGRVPVKELIEVALSLQPVS
jgi:hypothetical protein